MKHITNSYDEAKTIADIEKALIIQHLERFNGNKVKAADSLGITMKTLYNKLYEYGLFEKYAKTV